MTHVSETSGGLFWSFIIATSQLKVKRKVLPYSLPSVGPGADPGVPTVSLQVTCGLTACTLGSAPGPWQVTLSHPGGRLPSLSARPAVTSAAEERHRPSTYTKLYCLVTQAHRCEQLPKVVTQLCLGWNRTHDRQVERLAATLLFHQSANQHETDHVSLGRVYC